MENPLENPDNLNKETKKNLNEKFKDFKFEFLEKGEKIDKEVLKKIIDIEDEVFPEAMAWDENDFKENIEDKSGEHLIIKNSEGEPCGCFVCYPLNENECGYLKDTDKNIEFDPRILHIEHCCIGKENQGTGLFAESLQKIAERAKDLGFEKISLYTREKAGKNLQEHYGAEFIRGDFKFFEEEGLEDIFHYLEIKIDNLLKKIEERKNNSDYKLEKIKEEI